MADRKVIVLGCGGFVGSHLTERLLSDGRFEVIGFDLTDSKCRHLLDDPNFHFTEGYVDVTNTKQVLAPVLDGAEAIFSLAAVFRKGELLFVIGTGLFVVSIVRQILRGRKLKIETGGTPARVLNGS